MQTDHIFLIDSDSSSHRLSVDGNWIGTFVSLSAAKEKATHIARSYLASATLTFELAFKWTLSDSETRTAFLANKRQGETVCG